MRPLRRRRLRLPRILAIGVLALVGFLYVQPLRTYLDRREEVSRRSAEVQVLDAERKRLERRLAAQTSTAVVAWSARFSQNFGAMSAGRCWSRLSLTVAPRSRWSRYNPYVGAPV